MHASLQAFAAYRQFIVFQTAPRNDGSGKLDKWAINIQTGKRHNAHDPVIWMDHASAEAIAAQWGTGYGYGFVFTKNDPFWFLDIDGALNPATASWNPIVESMCSIFKGCAVEISTSGTGLHIFGRGTPPPHGCTNKVLGLEFYHEGRFAALTGWNAYGDANTDASAILGQFCASYFPAKAGEDNAEWSEGPVAEWNGPTDDNELLRRAHKARSTANAFNNKAGFAELFNRDEAALARTYPNPGNGLYDESGADQALANHLAFWTGRDCARIERLMRRSRLVRDKWDEPRPEGTWLQKTILNACARGGDVCKDAPTPAPSSPIQEPVMMQAGLPQTASDLPPQQAIPDFATDEVEMRGGSADGTMQREVLLAHFKGCIYVRGLHRAYVPGGLLLKPEQFKVSYGGWRFQIDKTGDKYTRDAWECFTQNELYKFPSVEGVCFRPELPAGAVVNTPGYSAVNTYVPVTVPRIKGDPGRFLRHLKMLLPNERDAQIMLCYMAACVQHQGVKFQWAPLIQGVEGNGKTLLTRCVAEAVGRRYVHWPKASKLAKEFNKWMLDKVFYAVEDIYVPDSRREVIEELKPMITGGDGLEIEGKGVDQISADICGNFIFNSNHKDAIRKTANDRRFCILYSAQQEFSDLARDGMTPSYFEELYEWLRADGYAIVTDFLYTFSIPDELNPAKRCQRAPSTTSTVSAIHASMGSVEQEILEAVDQGQQGFCGGWISSHWLDVLLERKRMGNRLTPHKRKEILATLGYKRHPALSEGRTNRIVTPDGTRPRLYVKEDVLAVQIVDAEAAAKEYERTNTTALRIPMMQPAFGRPGL